LARLAAAQGKALPQLFKITGFLNGSWRLATAHNDGLAVDFWRDFFFKPERSRLFNPFGP